MKSTRILVAWLIISVAASSLALSLLLAQEKKSSAQADLSAGEPDILWLWGEVSAVDTDKGVITVKYLDYETDTEKEAAIYADEKTAYENASSIADIKPKDIVSVDYVSGAQGSNIARNISVEKPEEMQPAAEGAAAEEAPKAAANEASVPATAPSTENANMTGTATQ